MAVLSELGDELGEVIDAVEVQLAVVELVVLGVEVGDGGFQNGQGGQLLMMGILDHGADLKLSKSSFHILESGGGGEEDVKIFGCEKGFFRLVNIFQ